MSEFPFRRKLVEPDSGSLSARLDSVREYCLSKHGACEEFPFGPEVIVYKVGGKMFALLAWEKDPLHLSLKCDPDRAIKLRADYEAITAGYHLSKRLWNTISLDDSIAEPLMQDLIDHSYELVVASLTKKAQKQLLEDNS